MRCNCAPIVCNARPWVVRLARIVTRLILRWTRKRDVVGLILRQTCTKKYENDLTNLLCSSCYTKRSVSANVAIWVKVIHYLRRKICSFSQLLDFLYISRRACEVPLMALTAESQSFGVESSLNQFWKLER